MSLLPLSYIPRSSFDVDDWFLTPFDSTVPAQRLTKLDVFDPFDEMDYIVGGSVPWLHRPNILKPQNSSVPKKYRVQVDCSGFSPDSIKIQINENKLIVSAHERFKESGSDDYSLKEFKKSYPLPPNAQVDRMVSFMAGVNLIVEVPLQDQPISAESDMFPRVVENLVGNRSVEMKFKIPHNVDPNKVHVSLKDRDLIFRCEETIEKPDGYSKFHVYQVN
jgi:HSP20 family molecular chaperone IbpA